MRLRGGDLRDRYRDLIARHAAGRSFADVGCMWNVDGAYAFHALDAGATDVVGVDLMPRSAAFDAANARRGNRVRFVHGDINEPAITAAIGVVDVVFCSGVLYHVPNPLLTLDRLRAVCRTTLILVSAVIREQRAPQAAVFLPHLGERGRAAVAYRSRQRRLGLDTPFVAGDGYANWYWAFTPSCVEAMARTAGFRISERCLYPHALCLVCHPSPPR
jgi:SAM-dependent methyltransferase